MNTKENLLNILENLEAAQEIALSDIENIPGEIRSRLNNLIVEVLETLNGQLPINWND